MCLIEVFFPLSPNKFSGLAYLYVQGLIARLLYLASYFLVCGVLVSHPVSDENDGFSLKRVNSGELPAAARTVQP